MVTVKIKETMSGSHVNKITPSRQVVGNFLSNYNSGILLDNTTTGAGIKDTAG